MLDNVEIRKIEQKIAAIETLTSAEFKVIICQRNWLSLKHKAHRLFRKYQLNQLSENNGVLILLVKRERELLLYGAEGIHSKVEKDFWQKTHQIMVNMFEKQGVAQGLSLGLHILGEELAKHFPRQTNQLNKVSNEIIFEK